MGQVNAVAELAAPPERVWAEFSNPRNFEHWLTIHSKWKGEVPAEFSKGAQATQVVTMLGMPNTITWTVDEYDAPNRLVISGVGMAGVKCTFTLSVEPEGSGSKASIAAGFEGQMIVGAMGKAVEKDAKKQLDDSLGKFAVLVG
ncbi:SRPBCC family protein [Amycolatopsis sp. GA6-003]|uniref:type II toxin-antitoxin system Rv0910 family toxin n=1 Tax=Amycolatopsis sp. GA6-003 TaxID=2652444 RepID=UPI00391721B8